MNKLLNIIGTDGLLHLCVSCILTTALRWLPFVWLPPCIVLLIGIGKEIYDLAHPDKHSAEWKDLICDVVGIGLGVIINLL